MTDSPPDTPTGAGSRPKHHPALRRHNRGGTSCTGSISSSVSSSFSSSSSSSLSATSCCSSPSPRPFSVPFSWEHRPGIPKTKSPLCSSLKGVAAGPIKQLSDDVVLLPLPPPLRSNSDFTPSLRKKRSEYQNVPAAAARDDDDPFAIALAQCAKEDPEASGDELEQKTRKEAMRRRRISTLSPATMAGRFRLLQLYGSCKNAACVAEATVHVPRSGATVTAENPPTVRFGQDLNTNRTSRLR